MKNIRLLISVLALAIFAGCTTPTNTTVVALENPNNQAKATQYGIAFSATVFLANKNNIQYAPELIAVADAFALTAAGNPQGLSPLDIAGIVKAAKVSDTVANEITTGCTALLGVFNSAFAVQFPTLKPNYNIFLIAVSNGLRTATGGTAVALPVIPWPPVAVTPIVAP